MFEEVAQHQQAVEGLRALIQDAETALIELKEAQLKASEKMNELRKASNEIITGLKTSVKDKGANNSHLEKIKLWIERDVAFGRWWLAIDSTLHQSVIAAAEKLGAWIEARDNEHDIEEDVVRLLGVERVSEGQAFIRWCEQNLFGFNVANGHAVLALQPGQHRLFHARHCDRPDILESVTKELDADFVRETDGAWSWPKGNELLLWTPAEAPLASAKVLAFDFDSTLIKPQGGRTFPREWSDIEWWNSCVRDVLMKKYEEGWAIVVMSNQGGLLKNGGLSPEQWQRRAKWLLNRLPFPVYFFAATKKPSKFRKPNIGMWEWYCDYCNGGIVVDKEASFYIGDAAGRFEGWETGKKKDFSPCDRMFGANIGVNFQTPEEFFLRVKATSEWSWGDFDPAASVAQQQLPLPDSGSPIKVAHQDMVVMMGYPASGKKSFARRHLDGYVEIDLAQGREAAEAALRAGKSVVAVSSNNADKASRRAFVAFANAAGVPVRLFHLQTSAAQSMHNNAVRGVLTGVLTSKVKFQGYAKRFEEPEISEGFAEIQKINFVPEFESDEHRAVYLRWQH